MSYTDTFGNQTLPPAQYGYSSLTLTANLTAVWPYNSDDTANTLSKIVDISCASGNILTLPDATQVSVGEDFLLRNVGSFALTIKNASGVQIATVAVGAASYFYLTDNTLVAGVFGVIGFGVGTSTADAGSLVGYGVKAIGASLNQSHPVIPVASSLTLDDTYRAKLVSFTGGTGTFSLTSAATLGDDYFVMIRNNGTGTLTLDPASAELIDGQSSLQLQPSESLMLISTGTQWYSVGYGRSTLYQFTQLTKDVSAGGTFTLSAAEASNKLLTFIGNPASAVTVIVPAIVAVYYTYSNISTAFSITVKTAAGSGTTVPQGTRIVVICDGTNVMSAQSAVANSSVSLTDGSVAVPALFFSSQTNTGLYKYGTNGLGFSVNGVDVVHVESTGTTFSGSAPVVSAKAGPNTTQQHTIPAVASDTFTLSAATQTLTNKTISAANNTITTAASGNLSATSLNAALAELQGDIDTRQVAATAVTKTSATGSAILPSGTTAQRDGTPGVGYTRFNATTGNLETWNGSSWAKAGNVTLTGTETLSNKTLDSTCNISGSSGQPFSFRNKLINGDFSIAQRGTSITNATSSWVYSLDRWRFYGQYTTGSATVSQQAFTIGQTDVPDEPTYFIRWNQTVAPAGTVYLTQPIENVRTFAGQTCTVSFWAKAASATTAFCNLTQYFGSGGSGDVPAAIQTLSLTTTWQKFTKTFTLDSISGKTLVAGNYLDLQFGSVATSTFTIDIAQVQVESGSIATPFEQRPIQVEEAMCQRYYQILPIYMLCYQAAGAGFGCRSNYPVVMRGVPSEVYNGTTYLNASGITTSEINNQGITTTATATATGAARFISVVTLSAEL